MSDPAPENRPQEQPTRRVARRLRKSRSAWIGFALVLLAASAAVGAEWFAPYDPLTTEPAGVAGANFQPPSWQHPLGTDALGRDLLSRIIYGARMSLLAGLVSVSLAVVIGGTAGAVAGYLGGWTESVIMRSLDAFMSLPGILLALLVWLALGAGWTAVMIAVGLINIPLFCRQVRANVVSLRHADYVIATQALGAGPFYVLRRVILPALITPIVVLGTLALGAAILEVAGLSFLGISGQIDTPEWGNMLNQSKDHFHRSVWPALAPGIAISLTVLGFNLLGDGLRDALDPRSSE